MGPKVMKGDKKPPISKKESHQSTQAGEKVVTNIASERAPNADVSKPDEIPQNDEPDIIPNLPKLDDSFSTNAALMLPVVVLSICTEPRAPQFGEVAWHTHTFLSTGGHGMVSLGHCHKKFLTQTLVMSSGRTSCYKGDFELVVFKRLLAVHVHPQKLTVAFSDMLPEIAYLAAPKILRHKNIVDLLGLVWETDRSGTFMIPTLILEFAPYGSLDDFLKSNPNLSFQEKIALCQDISFALQTLHYEMKAWGIDFGLFHGDIKPENIMIFDADSQSSEGQQASTRDMKSNMSDPGNTGPQTSESGSSAQTYFKSRLPVKEAKFGTPKWSAPEVHRKTGDFNPALAELYSFGLVAAYIFFDGTLPLDLALESDRINKLYSLKGINDNVTVADTNLKPEDQMLRQLLGAISSIKGVNDKEKALIETIFHRTLRADPNSREFSLYSKSSNTGDQLFKQISKLFGDDLESREREIQTVLGSSIDVWNSLESHMSYQSTLSTINLACQMPYPFRLMLDEHFSKIYRRLPDSDPWKSHVAFFLGLLAFSPSLTSPGRPTIDDSITSSETDVFLEYHRRALIGSTWLRRAALLDHGSAGIILARLILASGLDMDEDKMAEELLATAAIGDSVFAHEEIQELAPVKYQELITAIKTLRLGPVMQTNCYNPSDILKCFTALYDGAPMATAHEHLGFEEYLRLLANSGKKNQLQTLSVGQFNENLTHFAATDGTTSLLLLQLDLGILNSSPNLMGDTPVHFAARCGNFGNLSILLKHLTPVSWSNIFGVTPLHYLFRFQDEAECNLVAKLLFEKGVLLEEQAQIPLEAILSSLHINHCMSQPGTALHWAVVRNQSLAVKVLLKLGACPYTQNSLGLTPWDLAVSARLVVLLRLFEEEAKCEDPEKRQKATTQILAASYPITAMISNGRHHIERSLAMISFLLEIGAATFKDVCKLAIGPVYNDLRLLKSLIVTYRQNFVSDHDFVRHLLREVVIAGEIQAVRELLRCLPPLQTSPYIFWIFHHAVNSHEVHPESIKILKTLLAHVAPDFDVNTRYSFDITRKINDSEPVALGSGDTLLHTAFAVCRLDLAEVLLKNSANPSILNDRGMTPLGRLIFLGNQQSHRTLESMIPSPNARVQPTSFAAAYPDFLITNALTQPLIRSSILHQIVRAWEAGRVHGSPDHDMIALKSVLEYFAERDPTYLQELLKMRDIVTDPESGQKHDGYTVLDHAACRGFAVAAQLLIHHGADPFALNYFGQTSLDVVGVRPENKNNKSSWDEDFKIQEDIFASMGMCWIDAKGPVAAKLQREFETRTENTRQTLKMLQMQKKKKEDITV